MMYVMGGILTSMATEKVRRFFKPLILIMCLGWLTSFLISQFSRTDLSIVHDTISRYFSGPFGPLLMAGYFLLAIGILRLMWISRKEMGTFWILMMSIVACSILIITITGPIYQDYHFIKLIHGDFGFVAFIVVIFGQWLYSRKAQRWSMIFPVFQTVIFFTWLILLRKEVPIAILEKASMLSIFFWSVAICFA